MENLTFSRLFKKSTIITLLKIFLPGILILAIFGIYSFTSNFEFRMFSQDPIQIFRGKPYIGILSNLGILIWCATATILLYSAKLSDMQGKSKKITDFLFYSGILTIFLMLDDLFLVHDIIFPEYLNIDDKAFYFIYGSSVLLLIYFFYKIILDSDYILLLLAFGLLAGSILFDFMDALGIAIHYELVLEDSFKFLGIISWFAYFSRLSFKNIRPSGPGK